MQRCVVFGYIDEALRCRIGELLMDSLLARLAEADVPAGAVGFSTHWPMTTFGYAA